MNDLIALPQITQERVDAYAAASGDRNPIHLDPAAARQAGFDGTIAHGMLILGLALSTFESVVSRPKHSSCRFMAPVRVGQSLRLTIEPDGPLHRFVVTDEAGATVLEGQIEWNGVTS